MTDEWLRKAYDNGHTRIANILAHIYHDGLTHRGVNCIVAYAFLKKYLDEHATPEEVLASQDLLKQYEQDSIQEQKEANDFFARQSEHETEIDFQEVIKSIISSIFNSPSSSKPYYLDYIVCEEDANSLGIFPVVYIWNENRKQRTYTISINGNAIGYLLQQIIPKKHSQYIPIREEVMEILQRVFKNAINETIESTGMYPSVLFTYKE